MYRKVLVGNWKMYGSITEATQFCHRIGEHFKGRSVRRILCPPFHLLTTFQQHLPEHPDLVLGGQTCSAFEDSAHTGDISAFMLHDVGCRYVLVGHSERRSTYQEDINHLRQQFSLATKSKLIPILCLGEQTEHQDVDNILAQQLEPFAQSRQCFYIAYEPVWAIGQASPPDSTHIFRVIRTIRSLTEQSGCLGILYGGSVTTENATVIGRITDGLLVGRQSRHPQTWLEIEAQLAHASEEEAP